MMLGIMLPLGYSAAALRFVPAYFAAGKWRRLSGFLRQGFLVTLLTGVAFAAIGIAAENFFGAAIQPHYRIPVTVGLLCLPLVALWIQLECTSRALTWMHLAYVPGYVLRPLFLILAVGAMAAMRLVPTAVDALWLTVATLALVVCGQAVIVVRRYGARVAAVTPIFHTKQWLTVSLSLLMVEGFRLVLENCDILVIGQLLDPDQVAIYFAAIRTGSLIAFVFFAVAAIAVPKFSKLHADANIPEMQRFISGMIHLMFWPSLATALVLAAIGPFVLPLFGDGFEAGYPALLVVLIGLVLRSALGPVEHMLNMTGHHKDTAYAYGIAAIAGILLNVAVIPAFGILGAAIASYGVITAANVCLAFMVRKRLGILAFVLISGKKT